VSGARGRIIAAVLGVFVLVLVWYQFLYKPASNDVDSAQSQLEQAQAKNDDLAAQVRKLQQTHQGNAQAQAQIDKLSKGIPPTPALDSFLREAYDIKLKSGVEWVSIAPSPPTPGAAASEIKMQIVVSGGYYQVLDYLDRLGKLPRIVVVDGINVATGASGNSTSTGSSATPTTTGVSSGAPNLSVTLTARMFTQAEATGTGSSSSGTGATSGTTGTPASPTTTATSPTSTGAPN